MLSRLNACVVAAVLMASVAEAEPVWAPSDGEQLHFDVYRNGKAFGAHRMEFEREGNRLVVTAEIDLKVKIGPFTPFEYAHDSVEVWEAGQVTSLNARTLKDGDIFTVEAAAVDDKLVINGTDYAGEASLNMIPASHWNKAQLSGETVMSTEGGELLPIETEFLGVEQIDAGGQTVEAGKYLLKSDLDVFLWYDESGRWVKCAFEARGQKVEYVLRAGDPTDA